MSLGMMIPEDDGDWLEREALQVIEDEEQLREAIQEAHGDGEDFE